MKEPVQIESGIPFVTNYNSGRYPFEDMKVGDSIKFNSKAGASAGAKRANDRHSPNKYKHGFDSTGAARVWRVE